MWTFAHNEDGGFQVRFPDGSATTLMHAKIPEMATRYLDNAMEKDWPEQDGDAFIANPFAAAFHDLFRFMTPAGMKAYDEIPEMFKMSEVNPYIRACLAMIGAMQAVPLLEQVSKPLWEGKLTLAAALDHTDSCINGGFEGVWTAITQQAG